MSTQNNPSSNISFINKDFDSLWTEILELCPKLTTKWIPSEANESDPLAVLLKLQAVFGDKANYNIDKNTLEFFPKTLTQKSTAYQVYDSLGFQPDWYKSANGSLTMKYLGHTEGYAFTIPMFTQVTDTDNTIVYTTLEPMFFSETAEKHSISCMEGSVTDLTVNNNAVITIENLDAENRIYFPESNIAQNGIFVIDSDSSWDPDLVWTRVENLEQQNQDTKCYKFSVDARTNTCYLQFPDNIGSMIGDGLKIKYLLSSGANGNIIRNTLTQFDGTLELDPEDSNGVALEGDDVTTVSVNDYFEMSNQTAISNGSDPLDIDEMYTSYKKITNILNTLVTLNDYQNYITQYTTSTGTNIVSNTQVSDRTNDLYDTYVVQSMSTKHEANEIVRNIENDESSISALSPYSIRFYPLKASTETDTLSGFNKTFEHVTDMTTITDAVSDVKAINHDYEDLGWSIILTYDLDGQIYLNSKVSQKEAKEIKNNIVVALRNALNASKLDYGSEVSYSDLNEIIKDADSRIQYIALQPVSSYNWTLSSDEQALYDKYFETFDLIKRSVLAGVTPWAIVQAKDGTKSSGYATDFTYEIGDENTKTYNLDFTGETDAYIYGTARMETYGRKYFQVPPNETLTLYSPLYKTTTTYSNYLYYTATLTSTIAANTPYLLKSGDVIKIYETKSEAASGATPTATLSSGTIVYTSFILESTTEAQSLGSANSISVQTKVTTSAYSSGDSFFASSLSVYNECVKNLHKYTLGPSEYLIYKDASDNFTIYEEGTTVWRTNQVSSVTYPDYVPITADLAYIQETGDLSSIQEAFIAVQEKDPLSFQVNRLMSFGSGYIFRYIDADGEVMTTALPAAILNNSFTVESAGKINQFSMFPLTSVKTSALQYSVDGIEWTSVDPLISNDYWIGIITMAITSTSTQAQEFVQYTKDSDLSLGEESDFVQHTQILQYYVPQTNGTTPIYPKYTELVSYPYYVQSKQSLVITAGITLIDSEYDAIAYNINGYHIQVSTDSFTVLQRDFVNFPTPGTSNEFFILPYLASADATKVSFALIRGGSTMSIERPGQSLGYNLTAYAISQATSISSSSLYYSDNVDGTAQYVPVSNLLTNSQGESITVYLLTTDELYDDLFNPCYVPSENKMIIDPTVLSTFFNTNHIFNRYALPKMDSTDNLVISSLSIQQ